MIETEFAVVGAGPAGLSAALEAGRAGVQTLLMDENQAPGGQLVKQIHKFFGSKEHWASERGIDIGDKLLVQVQKAGVRVMLDTVVWGIFDGGKVLAIKEGDRNRQVLAQKILLATGASENPLAFSGWTLPGVLGAGAAQTLVNLHRVLPGTRVLMVGAGNVGLIVAYQLLQAGARVVAVVEALPTIGGYGVHASKIRRMGVPVLTGHTVKEASGNAEVERATVVRLDDRGAPLPGTEREFEVDTICIAVGLHPLAELAWICGCQFDYIPELGGHVPVHTENMETTVPGVYVAGDVAGIEEATVAMEEGRLTGVDVARCLGYISDRRAETLRREIQARIELIRTGPFGEALREGKEKLIERRG
jgi:thioredoxin reductase